MIFLLWAPTALGMLGNGPSPPKISSVRMVGKSPTEVYALANRGIVSVYWQVFLSNIDSRGRSIVRYRVKQTGSDFPEIDYPRMNQGLYLLGNGTLEKLELPLEIPPDSTKEIYVRLGLMTSPKVLEIIEENFSNGKASDVTTGEVVKILYSQGTDFYENIVENVNPIKTGPPIWQFQRGDELREQEFTVSFVTAREEETTGLLSWYKFGGFYDSRP